LIKEGDFLIAEDAKLFQFYNCFARLRQSGWIFIMIFNRVRIFYWGRGRLVRIERESARQPPTNQVAYRRRQATSLRIARGRAVRAPSQRFFSRIQFKIAVSKKSSEVLASLLFRFF